MGIRLYPNTKNPVALERIVGVPAGTAARLAEMEKRHAEEREGNTDPEHTARRMGLSGNSIRS